MVIVVVDEKAGSYDGDFYGLYNLCIPSNIHEFHTFADAKVFLGDRALDAGEHIDMILLIDHDSKWKYQHCDELTSWAKNSTACFSEKNFKFNSIPIVQMISDFSNDYYDHLELGERNNTEYYAGRFPINDSHCFASHVKNIVREWKQMVINDLRTLQINLRELQGSFGNYQKPWNDGTFGDNASCYSHQLLTLSEDFVRSPRRLNYEWLDVSQIWKGPSLIHEYNSIMNGKYHRSTDEREALHKFYLRNPEILLRESYAAFAYEQPILNQRYGCIEIPDFLLQPRSVSKAASEILEIKLPDKSLGKRKCKFFVDGIEQVNNARIAAASKEGNAMILTSEKWKNRAGSRIDISELF
jgi:hypothetical protein